MELKIIDNHVHIAGRGDVYPDDLYWSKKFEKGIGFRALTILKGWAFKRVGDKIMIDTALKQINQAKRINHVVLLAFDNVYDIDGTYLGPRQPDQKQVMSTIYVSNEFVRGLSKANSRILLGISVHPFRDDAVKELDKYRNDAALCKWMPSAHLIDFTDSNAQGKLEKFYAKLADIGLPLLLHTGVETSIPSAREGYDKFNSPKYIEKALDMGVPVILAHCGCSYFDALQEDFVEDALRLFNKQRDDRPHWKLYADISALFSPFRARKVLNRVFKNINPSKLIYGSDFPNPAKSREEFFLRPFFRYARRNLLDRSAKIAHKWLKYYYSESEAQLILTGFHRLLIELNRSSIIKP